jgi:hypothetical protein
MLGPAVLACLDAAAFRPRPDPDIAALPDAADPQFARFLSGTRPAETRRKRHQPDHHPSIHDHPAELDRQSRRIPRLAQFACDMADFLAAPYRVNPTGRPDQESALSSASPGRDSQPPPYCR